MGNLKNIDWDLDIPRGSKKVVNKILTQEGVGHTTFKIINWNRVVARLKNIGVKGEFDIEDIEAPSVYNVKVR